jgi:pimeloyl-ACP methyl ester carboxylesterase
MGIQPQNGYIYDQFLIGAEAYVRHGFVDEGKFEAEFTAEPEYDQLDSWETNRSMVSRLGWKPYMFNHALPGLLRGVNVPARIIVGDADQVVPPECAELYRQALPNASIETMRGCGHAIDVEYPDALASAVHTFLSSAKK